MTTERARRGRGRPPHPDILTPREWQVLDLLREGLTNEQIAQRLDVSLATAKYHVSEILTKLGLTSREEAAAWQPEPVPTRWWQRATAWVPRRAWPLAGAAGALAALAALAWVVFGASAGEDDNTTAGQPTTSAATALTIDRPQEIKLISIRGQAGPYEPGTLWMSNLDGSGQRQLVARSDVSEFIGAAPDPSTGETFFYYSTKSPDNVRDVWRVDVAGQEEQFLGIEPDQPTSYMADVSRDGHFLAYTDRTSLRVLDLVSRETREVPVRLAENPCLRFNSPEICNRFFGPNWSPDGTRLLVSYAGGLVILDPFSESEAIPVKGCCYPWWSPSGDSVCSLNGGETSPNELFVHSAPGWQTRSFLRDYQLDIYRTPRMGTTSYLSKYIARCTWLDDEHLAVVHGVFIDPDNWQIDLLNLNVTSGEVDQIARHAGTPSTSNDAYAIPGREMILMESRTIPPYTATADHPLTPVLINVETNARHPILTTEDWVVAAVPAEAIAP